ncbi:NAD(P)/FAD-dependent oxidoreductase [Aestuariibaculum suncheonense]|uniref:NAD(P)/FAD-dependent oxidoreductase n=1 Tax=Aestuariibaculum suncheonense TaxID=1028745 RepID=A0A8J6UIK5_9FLAO|nr:FAD/NAD(P)-binding oxidoreductase [Aestuariibaculum suncheonense]MBD0834241.1 NAD(P)/FAD-dependent oxidoreductase [Aestuariibaculum suncheonense]
MEHIVIIGNGISGITAARHIRKLSDKKITVISAESEYFFSRTALMYVYMGHMTFSHTQPYENWFWTKNNITLKKAYVQAVDTDNKTLHFSDDSPLRYDKLIIASGSKPNKFGWPGEHLKGVQGLYSKPDLELLEINAPNNKICKRAVIVGGGLIGIELAEMLSSRQIPVTFLVRESSFWNNVLPENDSQLVTEHIKNHHIDLRLSSNLKEIKSDDHGKVKSIVIEETGEEIPCNFVGLTAGVSPNINFLKSSKINTNKGVVVNRFLETNIEDVYAIGDCAEQLEPIGNRRSIEAVWYTGRMMGEVIAQTICIQKMPYQPSHWFNSAKFFDIEYQTYGWVNNEKNKPECESHFHWKDKDHLKCITIAYNKNTNAFLGINAFGIRLRHETFETWLNEGRDVDYVINHLEEANFDPEFSKTYHPKIQNAYNRQLQHEL